METRLLTRHDMARLLGADDVEGFLRVLAESDYGETMTTASDPHRFEKLLHAHLASTLHLVVRLSRDPEVTDLLKSRYDYYNLKGVLKTRRSGQKPRTALSDLGQIEPSALAAAVEGERLGELPPHVRRALRAADGRTSEGADPQGLDVAVDREMFSHLLSVLRRSAVPFLWGWAEREIDLVNIRTFLRLLWSQKMPELLRESLIEGGSLAIDFYRSLKEEPLEGLSQRFGPTRYGALVDEGMAFLLTQGSFSRLEQVCDGFLISYLRRAAFATFGVEPLMAYVLVKEFETKAVRTVFVGKWNRIPPESIRGTLPDVYL